MWCTAIVAATLVALCHGQTSPLLKPSDGELLHLSNFGADIPDPSRLHVRDAAGLYLANHSSSARQWRHEQRGHLLLTYEPQSVGPAERRRWLVRDLERNETLAELPAAGAAPWRQHAARWKVADCAGRPAASAARLWPVERRRRQSECSTLTWRLVGLSGRHRQLAPLAGRYRVSQQYRAGAPVYRSDAGAELSRVVDGARSGWVLRSAGGGPPELGVLDEFADRVNWIRTERLVAANLPGSEFRDRLTFLCEPAGWAAGDADFQLADLDGYSAVSTRPDRFPWMHETLAEADRDLHRLAYGAAPPEGARALVFLFNSTAVRGAAVEARLDSPPVRLAGDGCALLRLQNQGLRLTVSLRGDDGGDTELLSRTSISSWRDVVVPLPGSGRLRLRADRPTVTNARLVLSQVLVFNETCDRLQGRTTACAADSCLNGGSCASVTLKHHLCFCRPGFSGERCERRVQCGPPPDVGGGELTHQSGRFYLDRAYYECKPGYRLAETTFGLAWATCHHDGTWVNAPRCERDGQVGFFRPYITCRFEASCDGFNTDVDNDYNVETDVAWRRDNRMKTSKYKGYFLTVYKPEGPGLKTARLRTPCVGLRQPGCLRLDYFLTNATLKVLSGRSGLPVYESTSTSVERVWGGPVSALIPLAPQSGPVEVEVRLSRNESEAAVDTLRVYRQQCSQLADQEEDPDPVPSPTWGPGQPPTEGPAPGEDVTTPSGAAAVVAGRVLLGLVLVGALFQ